MILQAGDSRDTRVASHDRVPAWKEALDAGGGQLGGLHQRDNGLEVARSSRLRHEIQEIQACLQPFDEGAYLVTHTAIVLERRFFRAARRESRWIIEARMDPTNRAGKHGAALPRAIANGHDRVERN